MARGDIEGAFPALAASGFEITSPETPLYNCIAWAAADTRRWWWPDPLFIGYWPVGVARVTTLAAFAQAFATLGYFPCGDTRLEDAVEKVAFYASADGLPQHAARQLASGDWTSKLGGWEDIAHHTLEGVEGSHYGQVAQIVQRVRLPSPPPTG